MITSANMKWLLFPILPFGGRTAFAQERPLLPAVKFDRSHTHRQNLCDRQRMLFEGKVELEDALQGVNLTVVMTDYTNMDEHRFFDLDGAGRIRTDGSPGVFAVLLDEVARRSGFRWRDSFGVVRPLSSIEDGNRTWADLLEWETETFDLSVERWARSVDRMARSVSFPEGWYDASIIMVSRVRSNESAFNAWSFLTPFETGVWFLIIATIIFTGFMYWLLTKVHDRADERRLSSRPVDAIFLSALTFTGHYEFRPNTAPAHILSFSVTFWALIIAAAYTANLASFLVVRNTPELGVSGIEDAIQTQIPVCIFARAREDDFITQTYPEVNLVRKETKEEVFRGLKKGECQGVITQMSSFQMYERNMEINGDCSIKWSGRTIQLGPSGFATAVDTGTFCTSLVSYVVNLHLVQMKAEGFVDEVWKTHMLDSISTNNCAGVESKDSGGGADSSKLSIKDVGGIFVFHSMLSVLALFIALLQKCIKRRRKRAKSPQRPTNVSSGVDEWEETSGAAKDDVRQSVIWKSMTALRRQRSRLAEEHTSGSSRDEEQNESQEQGIRPEESVARANGPTSRRTSIWTMKE